MNKPLLRNKWLFFGVFLAFLGFLGLRFLQTGDQDVAPVVTDGKESAGTPVTNPGSNERLSEARSPTPSPTWQAFLARQPDPLPDYLADVSVDGGVRTDARGRLILEPAVRDMFEFFLSAAGDASLEMIQTWVAHYLDKHLPPEAAQRGWRLFQRYLGYRESLAEVAEPGPTAGVDELSRALRQRNRLRREALGQSVADAFFSHDEAYDQYMLARRRIAGDDQLSPEQKAARLEQAQAQLPEPLQAVREETTQHLRARERVRTMREQGASEAQVRAWREAELGAAATDRLEQLEARRQQWRDKYGRYREEKAAMQLEGLSPADREAAIERLRQRHFKEREVPRARALDRIRAQQGSSDPAP